MIPSLKTFIDLHNSYYTSNHESRPRDEMESESISPRVIEEPLNDDVKEYQAQWTSASDSLLPPIQRFIIDKTKCDDYKVKEEDVFKKALNYLMAKEIISFEDLSKVQNPIINNVVLVDIFVWDNGSVKLENEKPEFHTICLWKVKSNAVSVIDPNDLKKTYQQIKATIEKARQDPNLIIEPELFGINFKKNPQEFGKDQVKDPEIRFYIPPQGLPLSSPCGLIDGMKRDCIDIAVKIAFVLIKAQKDPKNNKTAIIDRIKLLSNQKINTLLVTNNACTGTLIRALQSSHPKIRADTVNWIKDNADICKYIIIKKFKDIEHIQASKKFFTDTISKHEEFFKNRKTSVSELDKLCLLFKKILTFEEETLSDFPFYKIQLGLNSDIKKIIPEEDLTSSEANDSNWTLLHFAINNGTSVESVLKQYLAIANTSSNKMQQLVGFPDIDGQTALHLAAAEESYKNCELICQYITPKEISLVDKYNQTVLHLAVAGQSSDIVNLFISKFDQNHEFFSIVDDNDMTALHWAAERDLETIFKLLYDAMSPGQICLQLIDGETALHIAVQDNCKNIVKQFVNFTDDAKKNQLLGMADTKGMTALHWAVKKKNHEFCKLLYASMQPEQIYQQTKDGQTALHIAAENDYVDIIELLISNLTVKDKLVGIVDAEGMTALHWTVLNLSYHACKLLYEAMTKIPKQICLKTKAGQTALHIAAENNYVDIIELLISNPTVKDELVDRADAEGMTALHYASHQDSSLEVCKLLYKDNVMSTRQICYPRKGDRQTALHIAAQNNCTAVVELLISRDTVKEELVGIVDANGMTALHLAVQYSSPKVCEQLYKKMTKEQVCQQTKDYDQTALHLAVERKSIEIVRVLISKDEIKKELVHIFNINYKKAIDLIKDQSSEIFKLLQVAMTP